jgi:hypothetical protein
MTRRPSRCGHARTVCNAESNFDPGLNRSGHRWHSETCPLSVPVHDPELHCISYHPSTRSTRSVYDVQVDGRDRIEIVPTRYPRCVDGTPDTSRRHIRTSFTADEPDVGLLTRSTGCQRARRRDVIRRITVDRSERQAHQSGTYPALYPFDHARSACCPVDVQPLHPAPLRRPSSSP